MTNIQKQNETKFLWILFLSFIGAILLIYSTAQALSKKSKSAQRCISEMFSDPDRYDPSGHFQIMSDQAPPFPEAIKWINENLESCMK